MSLSNPPRTLALMAALPASAMASALAPAGPAALAIADIAWVMFIGGSLIFAVVVSALLHAVRRGQSAVRPGRWLWGAGIAFPVIVLTALAGYSQWRSSTLRADPPSDALQIGVTGRMWWWEVRYRDPATGAEIFVANEIRVPIGRTISLGLTSADVIHSVWVPALAGKMDTVPGRVNRLVFSAAEAGTYRGQCAEFCGEQHARMGLHVVALEPQAFEAWLAQQAQPALAPETAMQLRGRDAFLSQRCGACHTVRGVSEESRLGPDLTHVGSRVALGAGTLANTPRAMAQWITQVQSFKHGARMPANTDMDADTLAALADYLAHLK